MRSENAFKNIVFYLAYEIFSFALGILFPRFIIAVYGSEVNGLMTTITRVLALINLIQAGAVGAAIFQMYKPVAENDYETQSAILYSSKRFYHKVTIIFSVGAVAVGVFYSIYLQNDILKWWEILLSFLILTVNGVAALMITSICDIYLSPHQKKYYLIISQFANIVVHYGLLTVVLLLNLPFVYIFISILLGGCANAALNIVFYKKFSKNKINKDPDNKQYVIPDRKYLMFQCIGEEAMTAAPTIIITTVLGLSLSSVFSIYFLVFSSIKTILSSIQLSFSAIFGNLVKTSDDKKIYNVYNCIELATFLLGIVSAGCVAFLIIPFVGIYTANVADINYIYPLLGIFTTAFVVIFTFRTSFGYVATVYGLFKKTCFITLVCSGIGIVTSILCVVFFGMPYAMIGLLANELIASIATIVVLKKNIPWFKMSKLFVRTGLLIVITVASTIVYYTWNPQISNLLKWVVFALILVTIITLVLSVYCIVFERNEIKMLFNYVKVLFSRRKKEEL